jgi:hypothetical protein
MGKSIKLYVLKYYLNNIHAKSDDQEYINGVIFKILPLIEHVFPVLIAKWKTASEKSEKLKDQDTFFRTLHFGANIPYWQYIELQGSSINNKCLDRDNIWISYKYLCNLKKDWLLSRDFFRSKVLYHEKEEERPKQFKNKTKKKLTTEQVQRDLNLLDCFMEYTEIKCIRGQIKKECKNWIYTRAKIDHALNVIFNEIDEDVSCVLMDDKIPIAIELDMIEENAILCLKVVWCEGFIEIFKLHRFQEIDCSKNVIHDFTMQLISNCESNICSNADSGANVGKYLQRINIKDVLEYLFVLEKTTSKVVLKSKVILKDIPLESIHKLFQYLGDLEFFGWKFD